MTRVVPQNVFLVTPFPGPAHRGGPLQGAGLGAPGPAGRIISRSHHMTSIEELRRVPWEEFPPGLATRLAPRVERLGYLGEFFKCAVHQPQGLAAFLDFTEHSKGALPARLVETIALTVASWMGSTYERNQHERLSVRLGFGGEWVSAVERLEPDDQALGTEECLVQRLVLAILASRGADAAPEFSEAVQQLGEAHAVAILMVVGRYVTHALIVNTLGLAPPVPSIFEDGFDG